MAEAQIVTGGVVTNHIMVDPVAAVSADGTTITWGKETLSAPEGSTFAMVKGAGVGWTASGGTLVAPPAPPHSPAPPRSATVSNLLDALSTTQRAAITIDHMGRLVARSGLGHVIITDPKVGRAAADMGLTPDAWFTLAGV